MPDNPPPLPPLKTDPKYGYYPWWPEDGDAWVHPEDAPLARTLIPSPRVWRRDGAIPARAGDFVVMHYGETRLRVRRTLWREVRHEGLDLGDWVEVRPRGMTNEPHTGQVREMHWDDHHAVVRYWLTLADGTLLDRAFEVIDLKPIEPPTPQAEAKLPAVSDPADDSDTLEI